MTDDDAELVALIDDELDEDRKSALLARLETDDRLRERYDALRETGAPIATSFESLLGQAPVERLRARLPADAGRASSRRFAGIALRELAAGFVIGLLVAGAAAWAALSLTSREAEENNWRSAVAEYTNLYTNETFSPLHPDPSLQAIELSAMGARVGADLTPDKVALPGLRFTVAFMLSFQGSPLGAIAYVDPRRRAGPALRHCQSRAGRPDKLGAAGRPVARLMVARRTRLSGDRPHSGGAGDRLGASARKAGLNSRF